MIEVDIKTKTLAKFCGMCKQLKGLYQFSHSARSIDGLKDWCKACLNKTKESPRYKLAKKVGRQKYREGMKNAEGHFTSEDILHIGNKQDWNCWWCGKACKDEYHVDHYIPLTKGGTNWPSNLVISCAFCNLSKHDKTPEEFIWYIREFPELFR